MLDEKFTKTTRENIKNYSNLIKNLSELGIDHSPKNYSFVRYYPPLGTLPITTKDSDKNLNGINIADKKIALFIYIPFCTGACSYCFYCKKVNASLELIDQYLVCMNNEMELIRQTFGTVKISSIYVGGGTPSILKLDQIGRLFSSLHNNFDLSGLKSFTFESSPETLTKEKIDFLKLSGVSRISMGVQSLHNETLLKMRRRYLAGEAINKIFTLKDSGLPFNIDFIYGLKNQNEKDIPDCLELIEKIIPPSVTFYQKWQSMKDEFKIIDRKKSFGQGKNKETWDIYQTKTSIAEFMKNIGYQEQGLFRFVQSESDGCSYCKTVWEDNSCIALGPSAYGFLNGVCYRNTDNVNEYMSTLFNGSNTLPIGRKRILTAKEHLERAFILGLKNVGTNGCGLPVKKLEEKYKSKIPKNVSLLIQLLTEKKIIDLTNDTILFTSAGYIFAESIIEKILDSMNESKI